nr:alpha/beta hydrolase [Myxococcus xanthus]
MAHPRTGSAIVRKWPVLLEQTRRTATSSSSHAPPTSWYFAHGRDEFFTVIQWDQRGAGKTYVANAPVMVAPTLTVERMQADAEALVKWARKTFREEKRFVLGHGWGSLLGLTLAQLHPEWLHAYIGVGQGIDARERERRGWAWKMEQASAAKNEQAIRDLDRALCRWQGADTGEGHPAPAPLAQFLRGSRLSASRCELRGRSGESVARIHRRGGAPGLEGTEALGREAPFRGANGGPDACEAAEDAAEPVPRTPRPQGLGDGCRRMAHGRQGAVEASSSRRTN